MEFSLASKEVQSQIATLTGELRAAVEREVATEELRIAAEKELCTAQARIKTLENSYTRLKEHYELLKRRLFVAKAERVDYRQLQLDFEDTKRLLDEAADALDREPETSDDEPPPPKPRAKPKGRRNLSEADLPVERVEILDEELEGKAERIGWETSYQLGYQRGGPRKIEIARAKYKLVTASETLELTTADKPKELMRKGMLAPSAIAHILTSKYCYGLPFVRQVAMLAAEGIYLSDSVMCRYGEHIGASLGPIVDACAKEARETAFCLSTDATGVAVRPEPLPGGGRQACRRGHFFVVLADQDHIFFEYQPKHTSAAVCEMFRGFSGYVQADAHSVYNALFRGDARESPQDKAPDEVGCWSHLRRKFWEAATVSKEPIAQEALLRIQKIFQLEASWQKIPPSKRKEKRQRIIKPLIQVLFKWLHVQHEEVGHVRGLLSSATGYATRHESAFLRFLEDGRLKITNNHSERALRPIAVGRKNWLFCGSDDHAQSAANLFSLIASCKLHGLEPETYLAEIIRIMPLWPRDRYLELSPRYWKSTRKRLIASELIVEIGPITVPAPLASTEEKSSTN
jgi:transposase